MLWHTIRSMILRDQTTGKRLPKFKWKMVRIGVYEEFFEGDLSDKVFTDAVWWEPNVFAS